MSNIDERIKELFSKDIKTKTMLVSFENLEQVKKEHEEEGWKVVNTTIVNNHFKITFQKVK